jgi:hypothetical protein
MVCAFHQGGLFGGARIAAAPLDELHDMHKKKEDFTKDHRVSRTAGASSPAGDLRPGPRRVKHPDRP